MKRLLTIAAICVLAVACSDKCIIEGTFSDEAVSEDSIVAVLAESTVKTIDSCAVVGGKFSFECPASDTTVLYVRIASKDGATPAGLRKKVATFIPTKGNLTIDMNSEPCSVSGSELTEKLAKFKKDYLAFYDQYEKALEGLTKLFAEGTDEYKEVMKEMEEQVKGEMKTLSIKTLRENPDNALGLQALTSAIYDLPLEELDNILAGASDYIRNNERVKSVRAAKQTAQATAEGKMFIDFEGKNPEGEVARLSDFVGRGKYVLVDFWASWCGPCRAEIPNIKQLFEKYTGKGLVVLGVAVWDNDNSASRAAMEQLDMKWNQIFVGEDTTPTDVYGILGIPHIILFAPDGTVLKRGLRGNELIDTVSALFE